MPRFRLTGLSFAAVIAFALAGFQAKARPVVVEVPAEVEGTTPSIIGYNMGENRPGSGVSHWLEYSGMTAARFWWPRGAWAERPQAGAGQPATEAAMRAAQDALRADPEAESAAHALRVAAHFGAVPEGTTGDVFSLSELRRLGVTVLCPMTKRVRDWPFERADGTPDWFQRWSYWRGIYLNAFYLAKHYDVARFQLFNEPDHPFALPMTQDEYLMRLQVGSDAARAAVADVNRIHGRNLEARISAPVSAGILVYRARSGRRDTRDLERGWGEKIVAARNGAFPGQAMVGEPLFDDYAIQFYSRNAERTRSQIATLRAEIEADTGGAGMPIIASEMNVSTAANFARTEDTLDTPRFYGPWGSLAIAAVVADVREIYVFRLTQTDNLGDGQIKKNGTHVIDLQHPLHPITNLTKGGAVARLLMHTMAGNRDRMAVPAGLPDGVDLLAARDPASGEVTALLANRGEEKVILDLRFGGWAGLDGARVEVAEVSSGAHGAIVDLDELEVAHGLRVELEPAANAALRLLPSAPALAEGAELVLQADGRWRTNGTAEYLRFATVAAAEPMILRVWLDDADGVPQRLLGHIVTTGRPQWLRTGALGATDRIRIETEDARPAPGWVTAIVPVR